MVEYYLTCDVKACDGIAVVDTSCDAWLAPATMCIFQPFLLQNHVFIRLYCASKSSSLVATYIQVILSIAYKLATFRRMLP